MLSKWRQGDLHWGGAKEFIIDGNAGAGGGAVDLQCAVGNNQCNRWLLSAGASFNRDLLTVSFIACKCYLELTAGFQYLCSNWGPAD